MEQEGWRQVEIRLTGQVQGVGLRYLIKTQADSLKLVGRVQNKPDSSVLIVAQGASGDLKKMLGCLKTGSLANGIKNMEINWQPVASEFSDFKIIF